MDLDDVDRAILSALLEDARASQRKLSRDVGV
ncbi:MAG TPA: AsnC family transcriptional regulator, partial [Candidatus Poseidoniales archaeon]